MKICKECNKLKDFNDFVKDKRYKNGIRNICKLCVNDLRILVVKKSSCDILVKKCLKCNKVKPVDNFSKDKFAKDGVITQCKLCRKDYYELNKKNTDRSQYFKEYRSNNKSKRNGNLKIRRKNDIIFNISNSIRSRIYESLKNNGYYKNSKTFDILGCSFVDLKKYLESKFEYWMTWENRGLYNGELNYGWDIDHIIPLSSAKTEDDIIKLNHHTNLQPLCSKINRDIKRDIINFHF